MYMYIYIYIYIYISSVQAFSGVLEAPIPKMSGLVRNNQLHVEKFCRPNST